MKIKQLLTKTLLVAAGLLVGGVNSVWADDVASHDFNSSTTPFTISDANRLSATYFEHVADGGDYYAKYTCTSGSGGKPFAYYNFSSNVADAATVTVEFDFLSHQATGHALISLADANYHTSSGGGFTDKSATGYGSNGVIFNLGTVRKGSGSSATQKFGINTAQCSPEVAALDVWCHASITVDNANRTVSYTIKNADQSITLASGTDVAFLNSNAQRCSQIDIYLGSNTDNYMYIDNLVITKTVSATSHTYSINAVSSGSTLSTIASSTAKEGALYGAYIPYVISKDSKYYRLDDAENTNLNGYYASYTMLADDATKEINYSLIEDVVFYGEAEDICTAQSNGKTSSNVSVLSNGGGKYAMAGSGYVTLTFNVPSAGIYDIKVGMNNTNSSNRGFSYQIDGGTVSSTITVNANKAHVQEINDQYLTAGDHTIQLNITYSLTPVFDYVLVTKDYTFTEVVGATDKTTTERGAKSSDITLKPGDAYNVKFCNYGSDAANKNNFVVLINNTASMYADWYDYLQDKGGWTADAGFVNPTLSVTNPYQMSTDGGSTSGNLDWANYPGVRKSFVDLTIKYNDGKVTIEGDATSIDDPNNIYYYGYAYTVADASADATVNLSVCLSWLGIVSVEQTAVGATVSDAGYATYVNRDYDLDFSATSIEAYKVKVSKKGVATLTKVDNVPANTPVLLKKEGGYIESIPVMTGAAAVTENELVAGTGAAVATDGGVGFMNMVLDKGDYGIGFYYAANQVVPTNRAYLHFNSDYAPGASAPMLLQFDNENLTGIADVISKKADVRGDIYDLQGRKVANPTKGLYIVNGRKVIFK